MSNNQLPTCPPRETLKEYLSGWMDWPAVEQIESHLAACQSCEQTVIALESDPETLLEPLRGMPEAVALATSPIDEAMQAVKQMATLHRPTQPDHPALDIIGDLRLPRSAAPHPFGAYELLQPLGRGGMGAVFLARHKQLNKHVAIKLLPGFSAAREEVLARFQREIRAAGRLNHPAIVAATDAGIIDGAHYLVMELIDGLDLSRIARAVGQFSIADACEVIRQAALGLSYAHAQGIVHRDIKPSNLMSAANGQVKILDFGLAQLSIWDEASQDLTTIGQLMGTLDYMAPEQAERCGAIDYRADLYALGATLFRLLCGRPPLAASPNQSPIEKLRLLANDRPPRLDTLRTDAPSELVDLVARILAYRPEDRPSSAAHIAELLQPYTADANLIRLLAEARRTSPTTERSSVRAEDQQLSDAKSSADSNQQGDNWLDSTFQSSKIEDAEHKIDNRSLLATSAGTGGFDGDAELKSSAALAPPKKPPRRWLAAAFALPAILAGIMITLELQKETLVIESEVPGVHVHLNKDGKYYKDIDLTTGKESTRVFAGQYEITLEGGSDELAIRNGKFEVAENGKRIATIYKRGSNPEPTTSSSTDAAVASNELAYEGKTLDEWLAQYARERSPKSTEEALEAMRVLVTPETSDKVVDTVLKVWPTLPLQFADIRTVSVLRKALPGAKFVDRMATFFDANPAIVQTMLIDDNVLFVLLSNENGVAWIGQKILRHADHSELDHQRASSIVDRVYNVLASGVGSRMSIKEIDAFKNAVANSPLNSSTFMLRYTTSKNLPKSWNDEILQTAIRAIENTDSKNELVVRAAQILQNYLAKFPDDNSTRDKTRHAVQQAFDRFDYERSKQTISIFSDSSDHNDVDAVTWKDDLPDELRRIVRTGGDVDEKGANATLELISLAIQLRMASQMNFDKVIGETKVIYDRTIKYLLPPFTVFVNLPDLSRKPQIGTQSSPRGTSNYTFEVIDREFGQYTPHDWLGFFIHARAMEAAGKSLGLTPPTDPRGRSGVASRGENAPSTNRSGNAPVRNENAPSNNRSGTVPASNDSSAKPAKELLYEGKTLDQWIDQFSRERSPKSLGEALTAMQALVSPENTDKISSSIYDVLPKLPQNLNYTVEEAGSSGNARQVSVAGQAIGVLRAANPGDRYADAFVKLIDKRDPAVVKSWITLGNTWPGSYGYKENPTAWLEWLQKDIFSSPADDRFEPSFVRGLAITIRNSYLTKVAENHDEIAKKALSILTTSEQLDDTFWLSNATARDAYPELNDYIIKRALRAMEAETSSSQNLASAALILRWHLAQFADDQTTAKLTHDALQKQWQRFVEPNARTINIVAMPSLLLSYILFREVNLGNVSGVSSFNQFSRIGIGSNLNPNNSVAIPRALLFTHAFEPMFRQLNANTSDLSYTIPELELIELTKVINKLGDPMHLKPVLDATQAAYDKVIQSIMPWGSVRPNPLLSQPFNPIAFHPLPDDLLPIERQRQFETIKKFDLQDWFRFYVYINAADVENVNLDLLPAPTGSAGSRRGAGRGRAGAGAGDFGRGGRGTGDESGTPANNF